MGFFEVMFRCELWNSYVYLLKLCSTLQVGFRLATFNIAEGFSLYFHSNINVHLLVTMLIFYLLASAELFCKSLLAHYAWTLFLLENLVFVMTAPKENVTFRLLIL